MGKRKKNGNGKFTNFPLIYIDITLNFYTYKNSVYEGEWKNNKFNGKGKITYTDRSDSNIEYYDGQWKNGLPNGQGKIIDQDVYIYEGEFKNGEFDGQGKYTYSDGSFYEGSFKDSSFYGKGVKTSSDGSFHEGEYKNGNKEGVFKINNYYYNIYKHDTLIIKVPINLNKLNIDQHNKLYKILKEVESKIYNVKNEQIFKLDSLGYEMMKKIYKEVFKLSNQDEKKIKEIKKDFYINI